jgi:hypothetical protein
MNARRFWCRKPVLGALIVYMHQVSHILSSPAQIEVRLLDPSYFPKALNIARINNPTHQNTLNLPRTTNYKNPYQQPRLHHLHQPLSLTPPTHPSPLAHTTKSESLRPCPVTRRHTDRMFGATKRKPRLAFDVTSSVHPSHSM